MIITPQVSILVPIYNVSPFIAQCAHSLFHQTFQDVEYIFVNDCTPDDSMEKLAVLIEQYPHRKEQIKIIQHSDNKGVGATRSTLLDSACGKYFLFVDSDDYIELDMVELLYCKAEEVQADITVCDYFIEQKNSKKVIIDAVSECMDENRCNIIVAEQSAASLWNKLIKKELYNRCCRLPEGLDYGEDRFIVVQLYFLTNKIVKVNKPLYHYVMDNVTSITGQNRARKHFENTFQCWDLLTDFFSEQGISEEYKNLLDLEKIKRKASLVIATNSYSLRKEFATMWHEEEVKYFSQLKRGKRIIIFLIRHKLFFLAHVYHYGVRLFSCLNN